MVGVVGRCLGGSLMILCRAGAAAGVRCCAGHIDAVLLGMVVGGGAAAEPGASPAACVMWEKRGYYAGEGWVCGQAGCFARDLQA